jgi:hypothetical protein
MPHVTDIAFYSPELQEAITDFCTYRSEGKHPLTKTALKRFLMLIEKLVASKRTEAEIVASIEKSILQGWIGVFLEPLTKGEQKERYMSAPSLYKHLYTSKELDEMMQ